MYCNNVYHAAKAPVFHFLKKKKYYFQILGHKNEQPKIDSYIKVLFNYLISETVYVKQDTLWEIKRKCSKMYLNQYKINLF